MSGVSRETAARALAAAGVAIGWATLALQLVLTLGQFATWGAAVWRYVGYFTILTNLLVAVALTYAAAFPRRSFARFELATATSIAMVGLLYNLLLRGLWAPQGLQRIADAAEHDLMPVQYLAYFLLRPRARLGWVDALCALIFPLLYVGYALARGAADGWYAYWFFDPNALSPASLALSVLGLSAAFLAMAAALAAISNRLAA